mgnify:CR=1 FL=1
MASKKELQKAAVEFRKKNPRLYHTYSAILSRMSNFIVNFGVAEAIVGIKDGKYYEYPNR